uniref:Non-specific serine/threonine protein kinase n=1 Tax=Romanomermis culicivorax TaxID=13658 RepID=A0A915IL05_ROMCU
MAFEQGRLLPTPEQVPFRLTRDIVDGFGICGVEGIFRKTCERVMRILRDSKDILLPIVSVLLHDPVTHWSLSPSKLNRLQPEAVLSSSENLKREKEFVKINKNLPFPLKSQQNTEDYRLKKETINNENYETIIVENDKFYTEYPKKEFILTQLKKLSVGFAGNLLGMRERRPVKQGAYETNVHAERAVLQIREKLMGLEKNSVLSIEGQVSHLIQQSMDPINLCQMYFGWQAFL